MAETWPCGQSITERLKYPELLLQQLQRHERMLGRQNDRLYGVERRNAEALGRCDTQQARQDQMAEQVQVRGMVSAAVTMSLSTDMCSRDVNCFSLSENDHPSVLARRSLRSFRSGRR